MSKFCDDMIRYSGVTLKKNSRRTWTEMENRSWNKPLVGSNNPQLLAGQHTCVFDGDREMQSVTSGKECNYGNPLSIHRHMCYWRGSVGRHGNIQHIILTYARKYVFIYLRPENKSLLYTPGIVRRKKWNSCFFLTVASIWYEFDTVILHLNNWGGIIIFSYKTNESDLGPRFWGTLYINCQQYGRNRLIMSASILATWIVAQRARLNTRKRRSNRHFDGLMQGCSISHANALSIPQACPRPSIYHTSSRCGLSTWYVPSILIKECFLALQDLAGPKTNTYIYIYIYIYNLYCTFPNMIQIATI